MFRKVLRDTHLDPSDISYVEMHGTGTPVGDPCEMTAVANVLGRKRAGEEPLTVGAVKANVGHSEAVSGPMTPGHDGRSNESPPGFWNVLAVQMHPDVPEGCYTTTSRHASYSQSKLPIA